MTDVIRVPYDELLTRAQTIREKAGIVDQEIKTLTSTIESLEWLGQRATRFYQLWEDAQPDMQAWVQVLNNFAQDLETHGNQMKAIDQSF